MQAARLYGVAVLLLAGAWPVAAQQAATAPGPAPAAARSSILTVDQERLFAQSRWGVRAQSQLEQIGQRIADENERLADQLSQEEARLTAQRATLDPAEFRRLAEAFDARATQVRRERARAVQDLNQWAEADRARFYRAALPLMGDLMQQRGGVAVLDRAAVFVSLDAIDITADLMARLDDELGDGAGTVPFPIDTPTVPQATDPASAVQSPVDPSAAPPAD